MGTAVLEKPSMTGMEIGLACSGVGGVIGSAITNWWKGRHKDKELDIQAQQVTADVAIKTEKAEVEQVLALAPAWKELVGHLETRCAGLETAMSTERQANDRKLEALRSEHNQQMDALRAEGKAQAIEYAVLKERVKHLEAALAKTEAELATATAQATADAATIHRLQLALDAKEDELDAAMARIAALLRDQADLQYRIETGTNQPDYTPMGGQPISADATLQERPR